MPLYTYTAIDASGNESTDSIEAQSVNEAITQLRRQGCFPTNISEKEPLKIAKAPQRKDKIKNNTGTGALVLFQRHSVRPKTLMLFTRQLATLITAGLPLLRGLDVLATQEPDAVLRNAINQLAASVQEGNTFSEGLAQQPKIFDDLYLNMVRAGEIGGLLDIVLARLAEFQEKAHKLKNKIIAAMVYPIIVLSLAVGIMIFLLTVIVPRFAIIFHDMLGDKPLPAITLFVIKTSDFVQRNWAWLLGAIVIALGLFRLTSRTNRGRTFTDWLKLHAPLLGDMIRKALVSRFSRTLGTLVSSGVPILQALEITRQTAGNTVIARAILRIYDSVKEGETIVQPLGASKAFPPMVVSMIDVGEETGQLPEMLLKIAEVYDDEVDNSVAALTSLLEPIMIVFLALVVGTIVIALFMPLISIISGLQEQTQ